MPLAIGRRARQRYITRALSLFPAIQSANHLYKHYLQRASPDLVSFLHTLAMATTAADAMATVPKEQAANGAASTGGEQVTRHSEVGHKSLLQSDALYQVLTTCTQKSLLSLDPSPASWLDLAVSDVVCSDPCAVHPGDERVPQGARVHEGAPRDHRQPPMVCAPSSRLGWIWCHLF